MASKLNAPSTIVTRRKKRDLEATMKSLKKLLEPSSRSRKKNIPRSITKKVSLKKTRSINRYESYTNSSEDGEYYPNKLKRKDVAKKIVLKPKHQLKVVIATNKRKRGTPHKGLKFLEEKHTKNALKEHETNSSPKPSELKPQILKPEAATPLRDSKSPLSVQTSSTVTKYELISPPHRSLTELTVDDLMRMDEDSLSEDDLMEVLTCPSPVWWEDPPDYFNEDILYLAKAVDSDARNEAINESSVETSIINPTRTNTEPKRTVSETKISMKMAKLENILGNIKNRVQNKPENIEKVTDKELTSDEGNKISNVDCRTDDKDKINHNLKMIRGRNKQSNNKNVTKNRDSPVDHIKRRKISSSGSDISINEEDLLRNLENIDIPIHNVDTDCTKDKNDVRNDKGNDGKPKTGMQVIELDMQSSNKSANNEAARSSTENNDSNKGIVKTDTKNNLKEQNNPSNDILDVRLIKVPTNPTNEVRVWSKVENFQRHNLKPEDLDVIDIENELVFSMIKCKNQVGPETICIDDDDDEEIKEAIDLDAIGKTNDKIDSIFTEMAEITPVKANKEVIKEDTITISKDLDVRLIETPVAFEEITENCDVDEITKPEKIIQTTIKEKPEEPKVPNNKQGIRILPMNMISNTPNSNTNKKIKTRSKKTIQRNTKEKTNSNNKIKGIKIINRKDNNVIRINDLDISLIKGDDHNVEPNITVGVKNDLCITLVKNDSKSDKEKNKRIEVPSKTPILLPPLTRNLKRGNKNDKSKEINKKSEITPVILPSLTKNPNNLESPKSINSISSEITDLEGTISDTNIHFLDEYDEDKRSVDVIFESGGIDVENKNSEIKS